MLPIVDPTETVPLEFDFTDLLKDYVGASITGNRITIALINGLDSNPGARLAGAATISGLIVTQFFQANAAQTGISKYRISCNIDIAGQAYKPTIATNVLVNKRTDE